MKISFASLHEKKLVLSNKKNLQQTPLRNIFIRSSKTHEERLIELNTRTILQNSTWGKDFRISGSGRLVAKPNVVQNNSPYESHFPPLASHRSLPSFHNSQCNTPGHHISGNNTPTNCVRGNGASQTQSNSFNSDTDVSSQQDSLFNKPSTLTVAASQETNNQF